MEIAVADGGGSIICKGEGDVVPLLVAEVGGAAPVAVLDLDAEASVFEDPAPFRRVRPVAPADDGAAGGGLDPNGDGAVFGTDGEMQEAASRTKLEEPLKRMALPREAGIWRPSTQWEVASAEVWRLVLERR
ncbi:MAG: hypothetical protein O3A87_05805 [Verrucomicrobia bacterium]|nr:hypothetical protein [Verrucomicrobiota bacterium]